MNLTHMANGPSSKPASRAVSDKIERSGKLENQMDTEYDEQKSSAVLTEQVT